MRRAAESDVFKPAVTSNPNVLAEMHPAEEITSRADVNVFVFQSNLRARVYANPFLCQHLPGLLEQFRFTR